MKQIDFEKLLLKWQMGEINTPCFYNRVKKLTSDNSDYAAAPPKLLDKMEKFAKECDDVGNERDAKEVRSWVKQLRIVSDVVRNKN